MTTTNTKATYAYAKFEEQLNWLEYQQGVQCHPLLTQYAESEIDKCNLVSASALMGLNTPEFIEYLERILTLSYGMGIEYDDYDEYENPQPRVIYPPIPKQWVRGLPRAIIDWAINLAYVNGMLDN